MTWKPALLAFVATSTLLFAPSFLARTNAPSESQADRKPVDLVESISTSSYFREWFARLLRTEGFHCPSIRDASRFVTKGNTGTKIICREDGFERAFTYLVFKTDQGYRVISW